VRTNLGSWERIGSVAAGAGLLYLATQRSELRRTQQLLGAGLLARGVTGMCVVKQALTGDPETRTDTKRRLGGPAGIHVRESILIRRPVAEVYRFWRDLSNLARFLRHVERVDVLDARRSHWVVRGPGGVRLEWDAEILSDEPDALLSWKSIAPADIVSAGSVIFRPLGADQTQIAVHFQYAPPAGSFGRRVAAWLGQDPQHQVREDLEHLRGLLERREDAQAVSLPPAAMGDHQVW
jgi:uncharacterized membrane protein